MSTLQEIDAEAGASPTALSTPTGTPRSTLWSWKLTPTPLGVQVVGPLGRLSRDPDRRLFAGPIRRRQVRKEVAASLASLAMLVGSITA